VSEIDKVMAEGGIIGKELWQSILTDKDAEEIKAKLAEVFTASVARTAEGFVKIGQNFELLHAPIEQIGVLADAAFAGLIADGASIPEALAAIEPALTHIQEVLAKTGQTATGPLASLLSWQSIIDQSPQLFEILAGVGDMITGLANSGLLTQQRFAALGATIVQSFGQLQAQGVAAGTALELMQPQLQKLWEAQQTFHLQTDAATQALIDQAVQQGIVGQNMKDVNSQILDVLKAIAVALGAEIPGALDTLTGAASGAAAAITPKMQAIADAAHRAAGAIGSGLLGPGEAYTGTGSNSPTSSDWVPMAAGGVVTGPMHALLGEDGPEMVVPLGDYTGGGTMNLTVNGTADRAFAKILAREINRGGDVRTAWKVGLK
jgi:hypothetical protein